jgi:hypothetical protein
MIVMENFYYYALKMEFLEGSMIGVDIVLVLVGKEMVASLRILRLHVINLEHVEFNERNIYDMLLVTSE